MKLRICVITALSAISLLGQSFVPMPSPRQQFLDANGRPLNGGKLYSYITGTSSPSPTYTDSAGSVANTNPVILDASGRATIFLSTTVAYRMTLQDRNGVQIWSVDGITAAGASSGGGSSPVSSVFGRVGAIVAQGGDFTVGQITGAAATNASNAFSTGTQDFSGAAHTLPAKVGTLANRPATCTVGEQYFAINATAGSNISGCTSSNTWTDQGGSGGGGSFLPTGGGTMSGAILSSTVGTLDIGTPANPFGVAYFETAVGTKKVQVYDTAGIDLRAGFWYLNAAVNGAASNLSILDPNSDSMLTLYRVISSTPVSSGVIDGDWVPKTDAARNLGATGARWKDFYFTGQFVQNGTVRLDSSGNATLNNLTVLGTCAGCGGTGSTGNYLPLNGSIAMVGPITVNGTFDIGASGSPWHEGWFALLDVTGAIQSEATGSAIAFQTENTNFQVDGNGNVSAAASFNATGGSSAYKMGGATVIDVNKDGTFRNVTVTGTCNGCGSGGTGAYLPLSGGTMTGAIIPSGALDSASAANPWHEGWFQLVDATGAIQSHATTSAIAFQTQNTNFQVNGNGDISGAGGLNMTGGGSTYKMGGVTVVDASRNLFGNSLAIGGNSVIDSSRNATVANLTVSGTCTGCGSGGGAYLALNGTTAMQGNLSVSGSFDIGNFSARWHEAWLQLLDVSGAIQSEATGSSIAFQTQNNAFQVDGNGNISALGQVNLTGGSATYKMLGQTVIDTSRTVFAGNGLYVNGIQLSDASRNLNTGSITAQSAIIANGGISIGSSTNSVIYVGNFGNFFNRTFGGAPSCAGVQNGWMGYDTSSNTLWICNGGVAQAH